ncbi:golgin subfamily A member 6-like protein 4 [Ochlerotatus camptorhynchus]|uniref:golgin subfamily A member 6-like protein 4 n=1 Tax=Ochlerotatus camptorhynchus TaxID=644619 RepID=UPI0031DB5060
MPKTKASAPAVRCGLFEDPDDESMIACDLCDMWYYYKCVHVGDSVADRSWTCPGCSEELLAASTPVGRQKNSVSSRRSSITVSTSASARAIRAALELQQLEDRKRLELQRVLEEEERRKQEAELEKARIEQEKLQREMEAQLERRRLDEERHQQEQERLQRKREAELERKRLENERRQQEQEQALAKKKLDDEKSRSELLRKLEEKYLAEKYRILNAQLEGSVRRCSSMSSISFDQSSDGAKALPDHQSRGTKKIVEKSIVRRMPKTQNGNACIGCGLKRRNAVKSSGFRELEQMGFAEKHKTLYAPRAQRVKDSVDNLEKENSNPPEVLSVPLPMEKSEPPRTEDSVRISGMMGRGPLTIVTRDSLIFHATGHRVYQGFPKKIIQIQVRMPLGKEHAQTNYGHLRNPIAEHSA